MKSQLVYVCILLTTLCSFSAGSATMCAKLFDEQKNILEHTQTLQTMLFKVWSGANKSPESTLFDSEDFRISVPVKIGGDLNSKFALRHVYAQLKGLKKLGGKWFLVVEHKDNVDPEVTNNFGNFIPLQNLVITDLVVTKVLDEAQYGRSKLRIKQAMNDKRKMKVLASNLKWYEGYVLRYMEEKNSRNENLDTMVLIDDFGKEHYLFVGNIDPATI